MRWIAVHRLALGAALLPGLPACADAPERDVRERPADHTAGERQVEKVTGGTARLTMRSGPQVAVALPRGFKLYPGAKIVTNTIVERRDGRHVLLEFTSADAPETIVRFYRTLAEAAGVSLTFTLIGTDSASLGGTLAQGGTLSVSARRDKGSTSVAIAFG